MKAIVYHQYGSPDVLTPQEVSKPIVEEDGVLVHVHAASLNPLDWHLVRGMPYIARLMIGLRKPKLNSVGGGIRGASRSHRRESQAVQGRRCSIQPP